ncbi:MAG: type II toxin-antitoxin system VapC family toxin [Aestuariivirga sp.]
MPHIIDTSAILAYLFKEKGHPLVEDLLAECSEGSVNLGEVVAKYHDKGYSREDVEATLASVELDTVPFDADQAIFAGHLHPLTRHLGLSLGDRACLALAIPHRMPVLTADRSWATLDVGVEIKFIR